MAALETISSRRQIAGARKTRRNTIAPTAQAFDYAKKVIILEKGQ
jgi:hypothetical protein